MLDSLPFCTKMLTSCDLITSIHPSIPVYDLLRLLRLVARFGLYLFTNFLICALLSVASISAFASVYQSSSSESSSESSSYSSSESSSSSRQITAEMEGIFQSATLSLERLERDFVAALMIQSACLLAVESGLGREKYWVGSLMEWC